MLATSKKNYKPLKWWMSDKVDEEEKLERFLRLYNCLDPRLREGNFMDITTRLPRDFSERNLSEKEGSSWADSGSYGSTTPNPRWAVRDRYEKKKEQENQEQTRLTYAAFISSKHRLAPLLSSKGLAMVLRMMTLRVKSREKEAVVLRNYQEKEFLFLSSLYPESYQLRNEASFLIMYLFKYRMILRHFKEYKLLLQWHYEDLYFTLRWGLSHLHLIPKELRFLLGQFRQLPYGAGFYSGLPKEEWAKELHLMNKMENPSNDLWWIKTFYKHLIVTPRSSFKRHNPKQTLELNKSRRSFIAQPPKTKPGHSSARRSFLGKLVVEEGD